MVQEVQSGTFLVTNEVWTVPSGARTVDLNNIGAGAGQFKTPANLGGKTASFVPLGVEEAYSFGDVGKTYGEITIDAVGTEISVVVNR